MFSLSRSPILPITLIASLLFLFCCSKTSTVTEIPDNEPDTADTSKQQDVEVVCRMITILPEQFTAQGGGKVKLDKGRAGAANTIITNWDAEGHWIEWTIEDVFAGTYEAVFRYSTDTNSPREMRVNGEMAEGLELFTLRPTGGWNNWHEAKLPALIALKQGTNIIRLTSKGGYGLNLDWIMLRSAETYVRDMDKPKDDGGDSIVILPAYISGQGGGEVKFDTERPFARNTVVANWDNAGHWLEWTITNATSGNYEVKVRYATDEFPACEVKVNSSAVKGLERIEWLCTGGWDRWREAKLPVLINLNKGHNSIRMTNLAGEGLNLDLITLNRITGQWEGAGKSFRKKTSKKGEFTFVVAGDHFEEPPQGMVESIVAVRPVLVVATGDIVFKSSLKDFKTFRKVILEPLKKIGARYYPCIGNHEFPIEPNWTKIWGEEKGKNYYSFDYDTCHFIVLDTNRAGAPDSKRFKEGTEQYYMQKQGANFAKGSKQYEWLINDMETTSAKHIFVFMHYAVFSFGGHYGMPAIQKELAPVFEKYKVTAVFSGHSHGYERFVPIRVDLSSGQPKAVPDNENGVTYIITASGTIRGNLYSIKKSPLHASFKSAPNFVVLKVEGDTVKCRTIQPPGDKVIDEFEIKSRR